MLKLLADEGFNQQIVRGVRQKQPDLDLVRVQEVGLTGKPDPEILEWAAKENRLLLTHDVTTMTHYAYERARQSLPMPGVFEISQDLPIGRAIEEILLFAIGSFEGEWEWQVRYLPLR